MHADGAGRLGSRSPSPWSLSLSLCMSLSLGANLCRAGAAGGRGDEARAAAGSVHRARCAARCLSLQLPGVAAKLQHLQNNDSLAWCQNHKQCSKCLEPCKESWDPWDQECHSLCEPLFPKKSHECLASCEFLQSTLAIKQGGCPAPDRASGFAAACVESCARDAECSGLRKCCPNGCGHTCQLPRTLYRGVPLKPRKDLRFWERQPGQLELSWACRFNVSMEPVVYLLQARWNRGFHPSEDAAGPWHTVAQTTDQHVQLSGLSPSRWYQFRVAAVNVHGTRGFTAPSKHFRASGEPSAPPAPTNLRVGNASELADGRVSLRVLWDQPAEPDVPAHHYKAFWSWAVPGQARKTRRRTTHAAQNWLELEQLLPNTEYRLDLQAVGYWGQTRLKSPKATLRFSTPPAALPAAVSSAPQEPHEKPSPGEAQAQRPPHARRPSSVLEVGTPFYHDGRLQVRVYWKRTEGPAAGRFHVHWLPESCAHGFMPGPAARVTQENHMVLEDLAFACKYRVTVVPTRPRGWAQAETIFSTLPCAELKGKGHGHASCLHTQAAPRPEYLSASFSVLTGNVTAHLAWHMPTEPRPSSPALTGIQVTWAEVTEDSRDNSLPNSVVSQARVLPADHRELIVPGLRPSTLYRLELQALTAAGEGPAAVRTFRTPALSTGVHSPPTRHGHLQDRQPPMGTF